MPIEVSPPPFANQMLPYTPKFLRQEEGAPGSGASASSMGPAGVAASVVIPPQPGAISSPHRAIPALPDAGYTSATLRPASSIHGPVPPTPSITSSYGPGSYLSMPRSPMYPPPGPVGVLGRPSAPSTRLTDGWMSTSLPAPRPGPTSTLPQHAHAAPYEESESLIAPSHHHCQHHHHHHQQHGHHSPSRLVDDDAASDASYYARPKTLRRHHSHRSEGGSVSSLSDSSSPQEALHHHHRTMSHGHHGHLGQHHRHRSPSLPPNNHSPISPSPLSLPQEPEKGHHHHPSHHRLVEGGGEPRPRQVSNLRESESLEDARGRDGSEKHAHIYHQPPSEQPHHLHRQRSTSRVFSYDDDDLSTKTGRHDTIHVQGDIHRRRQPSSKLSHSHSHHRHASASMIPPPQQSQAHRVPSPHPLPAPNSVAITDPYRHPVPRPLAEHRRPRAVSMQHAPRTESSYLSPGVAAGFGGMDMGFGGASEYRGPHSAGLGQGQGDQFDDRHSVAGSALTFLDGPVNGRTSQYGLPQYQHQVKPDPRRFMVQRGLADVYVD